MMGSRRRVGGGEQGMSGASGRCICSAVASAVNSRAWTNMNSETNAHSPTHLAAYGSGTPQPILHE